VGIRQLICACSVAALLTPALASADVSVVFSKDEISIIQNYYPAHAGDSGKNPSKNSSKQKGKPLPPGIAKNLARGKPLPPGIAKKSLPGDLARQLPPVRSGYERIIVDGRVLLVETATQMIHDVLMDAMF